MLRLGLVTVALCMVAGCVGTASSEGSFLQGNAPLWVLAVEPGVDTGTASTGGGESQGVTPLTAQKGRPVLPPPGTIPTTAAEVDDAREQFFNYQFARHGGLSSPYQPTDTPLWSTFPYDGYREAQKRSPSQR